jgi:hypothetical protein
MLAINQSAQLAKQHNLASTDRDDIEAKAIQRAAKQEACHLRFNALANVYELEHPAIGRSAIGGDFAVQSPVASSPMTIRSITGKPVLHIIINTNGPLPCVEVIDPNASRRIGGGVMSPASAIVNSQRFSTIPQLETSSDCPPLMSLDLTKQVLHIDANSILELLPSLFSIDSLVSAVLAVAVADPVTNTALGTMELWKPQALPATRRRNSHSSTPANRPGSVRSYAGSTFYATIAEREEAEEEAKLMRRTCENDMRGGSSRGSKSQSRTWFGRFKHASSPSMSEEEIGLDDLDEKTRSNTAANKKLKKSKKSKKSKTKKITLAEFDLEKLNHYQSGDRRGQELPGITRTALSGMIIALKFFVWALTMVVQFLAWLLVNGSRAVTSEKF